MPHEGVEDFLHKNSLNTFPLSPKCLECILHGSIPSLNLQIAASTYFLSMKKLSILQILELDSSSLSGCISRSKSWNFSLSKFNISLLLSVPFIVVIVYFFLTFLFLFKTVIYYPTRSKCYICISLPWPVSIHRLLGDYLLKENRLMKIKMDSRIEISSLILDFQYICVIKIFISNI